MKGTVIFLILAFLMVSSPLRSQFHADTIDLKVFSIRAKQQKHFRGLSSYEISETAVEWNQSANLSEILSGFTPVFIKSYGREGVASISMRGSNASQVQTLWNGFTINSPTLGQLDFSLIPVQFTDKISILPGGASLYETTGGIGGEINLQNFSEFNKGAFVQFTQSAGSFNSYNSFAKAGFSNNRLSVVTRILYKASENDFDYINVDKPGNPGEKRKNAEYKGLAFQQEFAFKLKPGQIFKAIFFLEDFYRQVPPTTVQDNPDPKTYQEDFVIRSLMQWEITKSKFLYKLKGAFFREKNDYHDEDINLHSFNKSNSWNINQSVTLSPGNHNKLVFTLRNKNALQISDSENLGGKRQRWKSSLMILTTYRPANKINFNLILKEEYQDAFSPLIPYFSIQYDLFANEKLVLQSSVSKNYRFPSLNDLFWNYDGYAMGNENLKPESSFMLDAGMHGTLAYNSSVKWSYSLKPYYSQTNDMILWSLVNDNQQIWKPLNIGSVESRGLEAGFDMTIKYKEASLFVNPAYTYSKSINTTKGTANNGKQLIYIPLHAADLITELSHKTLKLLYTLNYTGKRYTVTDNSRYLPSYIIHNAGIEKSLTVKSFNFSLQFRINNLSNKQYRAIVKQPMPGRNYLMSLKIMIN